MAFKRTTDNSLTEKEAKIVDELVRKSLDVNPEMRRGRDTQEVLDELRGKAIAKAKAQPSNNETPIAFSGKDPRLQTIEIFMRDKAQNYPKIISELEARIESIRKEIEQTRIGTISEITELVKAMLLSGAQTQGIHSTLNAFRDLLTSLKTNEFDIVNNAGNKKR
ncbi:MAG: hypothetical protein JW841_17730 [Deltaproteobacteria bacterium]|nr:hypothetical protein [Deltaproteobacteria bacterium]